MHPCSFPGEVFGVPKNGDHISFTLGAFKRMQGCNQKEDDRVGRTTWFLIPPKFSLVVVSNFFCKPYFHPVGLGKIPILTNLDNCRGLGSRQRGAYPEEQQALDGQQRRGLYPTGSTTSTTWEAKEHLWNSGQSL